MGLRPVAQVLGTPTGPAVRRPEHGYKNLAVFYQASSFNCLGCQNWLYREASTETGANVTPAALAARVNTRAACICYFGGDPSPQFQWKCRLPWTKISLGLVATPGWVGTRRIQMDEGDRKCCQPSRGDVIFDRGGTGPRADATAGASPVSDTILGSGGRGPTLCLHRLCGSRSRQRWWGVCTP